MANYGIQFKDKDGNKYYPCPFPIGAIYLSTVNTNPSTYFGGQWTKITGGYLYAANSSTGQSSYTGTGTQSISALTSGAYSGTTGGTALTIDQIPSHTHGLMLKKDGNYGSTSHWRPTTSGSSYGGYVTATGGGQEHTHSIPSHTHSIPSHSHAIAEIYVFMWKRIS